MVIEDLFYPTLAANLGYLFHDLIRNAQPTGKVGDVGNNVYAALNYTPPVKCIASSDLSVIASLELRSLIAEAFNIRIDENVLIGMHRHNPPSKAGWAHTDFAVVSFPRTQPNLNGVRVFPVDDGCTYADDTAERQPNAVKTARSLACLYYVANEQWEPGKGGETGVFSNMGERLIAKIPPKNNSLFVFECSPLSYHAYLGSEHMERNSFIWWYHSDPGYLLDRYSEAVDYKRSCGLDPWDRWTKEDEAKWEPRT